MRAGGLVIGPDQFLYARSAQIAGQAGPTRAAHHLPVPQICHGRRPPVPNGQAAPTGTRAPSIIVGLIVAAVVGLSNGDDEDYPGISGAEQDLPGAAANGG
jgi:hypothetical protein